ncbi:MAG: dolichol-phosphate mannosyltransferase [Rhodospirillaceae bacterium TMED8]|nr:dolichol-phosphate mannosyltransferase [Magnetovibrio sp.]OUT48541.1 MAG: dolichol-phosphate mannosyltransferase [Rhodospirillaceae bacterium TMED8]
MKIQSNYEVTTNAIPNVAVVVPVRNEAENVFPLIEEIVLALAGLSYEIIFVNDGSTDDTSIALRDAEIRHPCLRTLTHTSSLGQSTAILSGVRAALGDVIITMDGDGQNNPADALILLETFYSAGSKLVMVAGHRVKRSDIWLRRFSSRVANNVRKKILGDATPDTGCGLKVFSRQTFLEIPAFNHMHRFLPALIIRAGGQVLSVPVSHRPRTKGMSNYGLWNRLWVGIIDLLGLLWLLRRPARPTFVEKDKDESGDLK